jgi:hypothetical protein
MNTQEMNGFPSLIVSPLDDPPGEGWFDAAARVARQQHGFVLSWQLRACGWSSSRIVRMARDGRIVHVIDDVYEMPGLPMTWMRYLVLGMLAVGYPASAARGTALALHRVRGYTMTGPRHLVVPYGLGARTTCPETIVHRSRTLEPTDVVIVDGIPATTPARSAVDLTELRGVPPRRTLFAELVRTGAATLHGLSQQIEQAGRIQGARPLRQAVASLDPHAARSRSGGELRLYELAVEAGLPNPTINHAIMDDRGRVLFEVDVAVVPLNLGFEYDDDAFHFTPDELLKDRNRDNLLRLRHGWEIYRFSGRLVFEHPHVVVDQMRRALDLAQQRSAIA